MTYSSEYEYLDLLEYVLEKGVRKPNRTGTDALTIIGAQCRYNLQEGFPLFTTKKVWFKGVKHELLWFLSGGTDIKYLVENDVHIWDDDAYRFYKQTRQHPFNKAPDLSKEEWLNKVKENAAYGYLGPVYGAQWRKWPTFDGLRPLDQVANLIEGIKTNPYGRRHILSAWNAAEIDKMGLPPCHVMSIFSVLDGKLHCQMLQRSCDMFLGVPFNVASYSLLTHMIANVCDLEVGEFIHTLHDAHIYVNHIDAVKEQLGREPRELPQLVLPKKESIDDFSYEDIKLIGYDPHPTIKARLVT